MKKNLIKKVFAVSLSIAMACSFLPTANPVTASAAAPFVSLKTTFKTLKVGQKYEMTLKNNTINWKIRKVETTNKPVATVYGKTTKHVMIKGKSEGRATIRVHVRTTERKRNNTKTLRCRVKVVPAQQVVTPPTQTEVTVTTPEALTEALNNANLTKITIKPAGAVNFTIPQGTYSNVDLVVDAPQSDIDNSATFKSIQIDNIKPETWTERGKNNTFNVRSSNASFKIESGAVVNRIAFAAAGAGKVALNGGTLNGVTVSAKVSLNISGTKAEGAPAIDISIESGATDSVVTTDVPANVTTSAKVSVVFEKNATGSTLRLQVAGISVAITNRTSKAIEVTRNDGSKTTAPVGTSTATSVNTTTPTYPSGGGSTGGGSSTVLDAPSINTTSKAYEVTATSGTAVKVTSDGAIASFELPVSVLKTDASYSVFTSGSATKYNAKFEYKVEVRDGNQLLTDSNKWYEMTENGGRVIVTVDSPSASGFASNAKFNVQVTVRVKAGCEQLDKDGKVIKTYSDPAVIGTFYYASPVALPAAPAK